MSLTDQHDISAVTIQQKVGATRTINSQTPTIDEVDASFNVTQCHGTAVPTDGGASYAPGCIFRKTNGGVATTLYINEGSSTSCDFNAVESSASTVTGVTAGAGLTGGGTEGTVTLTVDPKYIQYAEVSLSNADVLALRATPKTLVAAQGAGTVIEFISAELFFDYTAAYTETADNMAIKYNNGSGAAVSQTIEATGFVDATADTATNALAKIDAIVAKTGCDNQPLVLHNTGDGEYGGGNAANVIRVKVAYRVHAPGW